MLNNEWSEPLKLKITDIIRYHPQTIFTFIVRWVEIHITLVTMLFFVCLQCCKIYRYICTSYRRIVISDKQTTMTLLDIHSQYNWCLISASLQLSKHSWVLPYSFPHASFLSYVNPALLHPSIWFSSVDLSVFFLIFDTSWYPTIFPKASISSSQFFLFYASRQLIPFHTDFLSSSYFFLRYMHPGISYPSVRLLLCLFVFRT